MSIKSRVLRAILLLAVLVILVDSSWAQQSQARLSDEEINARMQLLGAQRNQAQDTVVAVSAAAQARITALEAELQRAKDEAAKCSPKPDGKAKAK